MSKVIDSLEKVLLPFAVKIGKQPHINAIKNGFIKLMPLTLAGAMFVLINNVFLSFGEGSFFYSMGIRLDASTIETLNGFKAIGGNVYNGTLGIMSLMAPFFIGRAGVGITLFLSADPGLLDPLHLRHYLVGPGELWQQLPPDHHGLYLDAAGGDGQRGWLGIRYL